MKTILFLSCVNSEYPVQLVVARKLKCYPSLDVVFCFNYQTNDLHKELQCCLDEGFKAIEIMKSTGKERMQVDKLTTYKWENYNNKREIHISLTKRLFKTYNHRKAVIASFRHYLNKYDVNLIILSNNKLSFFTPYFIEAAHLEKIKVVFLPFGMESLKTYHTKLSQLPNSNSTLKGFQGFRGKILSLLFEEWIFQSPNGNRELCTPIEEILTMNVLSAAPYYPNSPYGGNADYLFAENNYMFNHYKELASAKAKIINTGAPYNDILYKASKNKGKIYNKLCKKYNVASNKKLILVSLPQYMTFFWKNVREYDSYQSFLKVFFGDLSTLGKGYNIFISVHPRMYKDQINKQVASFKNIIIVEEYIAELIPLCEFYICCESSTTRMAIACNKPVINYDFYRFNFDLFAEKLGVATVRNREEFSKIMTSFCAQSNDFLSYRQRQRKVAEEFGPIDNHAMKNITQTIFSILNSCEK